MLTRHAPTLGEGQFKMAPFTGVISSGGGQLNDRIESVFPSTGAPLFPMLSSMMNQDGRKSSVTEPNEPCVNGFPVFLAAFIDSGKQAGDIVENRHPNIWASIENLDHFLPHRFGSQHEVFTSAPLINQFTRQELQGSLGVGSHERRCAISKIIQLHFTIDIQHANRSLVLAISIRLVRLSVPLPRRAGRRSSQPHEDRTP